MIEATTETTVEPDLEPADTPPEPHLDEEVLSVDEELELVEPEPLEVADEIILEPEIIPESKIELDKSLSKNELLDRLPPEVRDAIPEEDMKKMSKKEVRSLLESYTAPEEPLPKVTPDSISAEVPEIALELEDLSKLDKNVLIELLPDDIKNTASPKELRRLSKKELISLLESFLDKDE